jgi:hypothetical protein
MDNVFAETKKPWQKPKKDTIYYIEEGKYAGKKSNKKDTSEENHNKSYSKKDSKEVKGKCYRSVNGTASADRCMKTPHLQPQRRG